MKNFSNMTFEEQDEFQERFEELKQEYAERCGWVETDGEYWWENNKHLYDAECYAYDKIIKEYE